MSIVRHVQSRHRREPMAGTNKAWNPLPAFKAADWQRPGTVT
ncbi:MAG: hypothetical protein Q8K85_14795 [Hyphomicrobium sp.]|nr:hypothetical protein [Hyphomicrobium sp.]